MVKRFGETVALGGCRPRRRGGHGLGTARAERSREDHARSRARDAAPSRTRGAPRSSGMTWCTSPPAVRELIGLTGQFAAVDEILTGRENLQMFGRLFDLARDEARRRAAELLERFDLADAADRPARTYSGGMRRRPRPRVEPAHASADAVSRRAHHRARSAQPKPDLGDRARARPRRDDDAAHDPVPGGGRPARRPDRGDRPREGDRRRGPATSSRIASAARSSRSSSTNAAQRARRSPCSPGSGCGEPEPGERSDRADAARAAGRARADRGRRLGAAGGAIDVSDLGAAPARPSTTSSSQLTGAPAERGRRRPGGPRARAPPATRDPRRAPGADGARRSLAACTPSPTAAWSTGRNMRHFIRQPQLLIFSTIQPIMFVLLFAFVFGGAIEGSLPGGVSLHGLPVARDLRAVRRVPGHPDRGRPVRGHQRASSTASARCRWRARRCWPAARSRTSCATS